MRVILFKDEDHSEVFLTESGEHGQIEDLITLLCTLHSEEYQVRRAFMEVLKSDPAIPDQIYFYATIGWNGNTLDEYEFNSVWTFTEEI